MSAKPRGQCEWYKRGHCKGRANGSCKASHDMRNCPNIECIFQSNGCRNRHPWSCRSFQKNGRCSFGSDCSYLHYKLVVVPLNAVQTQPMPPETAVILTTHPIEDQIPHNPMLQQIIEQQEIIKSLQDQLSAQHEEMSVLKVNVRSLTDAFNERINQKVAEGTSTLWEKVEKLEEDIPSINSKITRLINNSISIEGASSVIDKLLIKFGENTVQILNTQMTKIERTLQQKLSTIEDKMLKTNGKVEGLKKNEGTHSEKKFGDQENSIQTLKTKVDDVGAN